MKSSGFIILLWWVILIVLLCLGVYHLVQDAEKTANRKDPFNDSRELIIESCWDLRKSSGGAGTFMGFNP